VGPGDRPAQVTNELLAQWWDEAMPTIEALLAAGMLLVDITGNEGASASAICDQVRTASRRAKIWLASHPCPVESIGEDLAMHAGRYELASDRYEDQLRIGADPLQLRAGAVQIGIDYVHSIDEAQIQLDES
jgi:hypothetical protein